MANRLTTGDRVTAGVGDGTVKTVINEHSSLILWDDGDEGYVHPADVRKLYNPPGGA